jgi:hypothetical protein
MLHETNNGALWYEHRSSTRRKSVLHEKEIGASGDAALLDEQRYSTEW